VVAADQCLPFSNKQLARRLAPHLILGPVLTVGYIYLFAALQAAIGVGTWSQLSDGRFVGHALQGMFLWSLLVYCHAMDGRLEIRVTDDGVGLPAGWSLQSQRGLGLSVTRERISGIHPDGASHFAVHRRAEGGTEVHISFPLRLNEADDDRASA
jgi:hypothetical protein